MITTTSGPPTQYDYYTYSPLADIDCDTTFLDCKLVDEFAIWRGEPCLVCC